VNAQAANRWVKIVGITVAGTLLAYHFVISPLTPYGQQMHHMAEAERHLLSIHAKIAGDKRFAEVTLFSCTGLDGSIGVGGCVPDEQGSEELRRLVGSTSPPVPVWWQVQVMPKE
jgi:hypothetical protein